MNERDIAALTMVPGIVFWALHDVFKLSWPIAVIGSLLSELFVVMGMHHYGRYVRQGRVAKGLKRVAERVRRLMHAVAFATVFTLCALLVRALVGGGSDSSMGIATAVVVILLFGLLAPAGERGASAIVNRGPRPGPGR